MRAILFSLGAVSVTAKKGHGGKEKGSQSLLVGSENPKAAQLPRRQSDSPKRSSYTAGFRDTAGFISDRRPSRISEKLFSQMHNGDLNLGDLSPWNERTGDMKVAVTRGRSHSHSEGTSKHTDGLGNERPTRGRHTAFVEPGQRQHGHSKQHGHRQDDNDKMNIQETYDDENELLEAMAGDQDRALIEDLLAQETLVDIPGKLGKGSQKKESQNKKKGFTYEGNKSGSGKWNGTGQIRIRANNVVLLGNANHGKFTVERIENASNVEGWVVAYWNEIGLKRDIGTRSD